MTSPSDTSPTQPPHNQDTAQATPQDGQAPAGPHPDTFQDGRRSKLFNLFTVTVEEGYLPECQHHQTLEDLVVYLQTIIHNKGTACFIFAGQRLLFTGGPVPHLLLPGDARIPLIDIEDTEPNLSGIIGGDTEYGSDLDAELSEEEHKHFDDHGPELPADDDFEEDEEEDWDLLEDDEEEEG